MSKWEELEKAVEKVQGPLGGGFSVVIAPKDLEDLLAEHKALKAELENWKQAAKTWENEADRRSDRYVKCAAERDALKLENERLLAANLDCMLHYNELRSDIDRINSLEPVQLDHLACIEDGQLRYVTGRKAPQHDCELYALPGGKTAMQLYTLRKP